MNRIGSTIVLSAAAALALAGCTDTAPSRPAGFPPALPTQVSQAPSTVALGQKFDVPDSLGRITAHASIDEVEVDPACTTDYGTPTPSKLGHYLAVKMTVETTAEYNREDPYAMGYPTAYDFTVTGPDGFAEQDNYPASGLCIADREEFRQPMSPSGKYRGWVLLESRHATGSMLFRPHFAVGLPGWELEFAAANPAPTTATPPLTTPAPPSTTTAPAETVTPAEESTESTPAVPYSAPDCTWGGDQVYCEGSGGSYYREPTSGEEQYRWGCQQGYITEGC